MRQTIVITPSLKESAPISHSPVGRYTKTVSSSDPGMARILESLRHPFQATVEVQEIKVPAGQHTHCVTRTNGNRTDSDCAPQTRFEEVVRDGAEITMERLLWEGKGDLEEWLRRILL